MFISIQSIVTHQYHRQSRNEFVYYWRHGDEYTARPVHVPRRPHVGALVATVAHYTRWFVDVDGPCVSHDRCASYVRSRLCHVGFNHCFDSWRLCKNDYHVIFVEIDIIVLNVGFCLFKNDKRYVIDLQETPKLLKMENNFEIIPKNLCFATATIVDDDIYIIGGRIGSFYCVKMLFCECKIVFQIIIFKKL